MNNASPVLSNRAALVLLFSLLALLRPALAEQAESMAPCREGEEVFIRTAPHAPQPGEPLRILAISLDGPAQELIVTGPAEVSAPLAVTPRGGPPWSLDGILEQAQAGTYRVELRRGGHTIGCREIPVHGRPVDNGGGDWDLEAEAFFSAWIERLFDAPPAENLSFPSLEPVLRDPARNFLHDYFGQNEDARLPATPDCADLPYFLRAYFAWKNGLPISWRACGRGSASAPPRCGAPVLAGFGHYPASQAAFRGVLRKLADAVHSGSARTALAAESSDFYPLPLQRATLWPGTVYADPYGHVLMVSRWIAQTEREPGLLLAVDAQPDNSVARKRFWEGTFLFADTPGAGPGFKAFRPLLRDQGNALHLPGNAELAANSRFAPYAEEQGEMEPEEFYAAMYGLIHPQGLEPRLAYEATLDALVEQVVTRVGSVENGEAYMRAHPGSSIPMPGGNAIFETIGPWEDYSTPSRDLRLLIALKVLERLPERIARYPQLFRLAGQAPEAARAEIGALHARRIGERRFEYKRSDGSAWSLRVADLYARRTALEAAYNPNDCAEARWGAVAGTAEYATCKRRAPQGQKASMEQYRVWFRETRRPAR